MSAAENATGARGEFCPEPQPVTTSAPHNPIETASNSQKHPVDAHGPGWQGTMVMTESENQFSLTRAASSK